MRYALIFAGVAAAAYDAYGHDGHGDNKVSSGVSTAPAPSKAFTSSKIGYTTISPGYGKQPVTVTSQYQPYPTCGAAGSDGKSCDKWNEDKYVSTVVDDCDSKKVTVTDVEKPITVYHTKTTITHYPATSSAGGADGKAYPTGSFGHDDRKNGTKPWYEMYEKVHEIKYKDLGAHGLPGYSGSGLCKSCDDDQPYKVKEYKDGKWSEHETTACYKAPVPETKTYEQPGTYTEPAKDMTVTNTITKPTEATTTAKAGVPVTYGGVTTEFKEAGVKTCAYGAYETGKDGNGNPVTSNVIRIVTVTISTTGKYEVARPTTTVYEQDTEVKYPTVSVYHPGVYHKDAQTVTITKSGDSASCEYKQTQTYPAQPERTPAHEGEYPPQGAKSSSKPSVDTKTSTDHKPEHPVTSSAPHYPDHSLSSSTPVRETKESSSTPCESSTKSSGKTKTSSVEHPYPTPSVPGNGNGYPSSSTSVYETKQSSSTADVSSSKPSVETKTSSVEQPHPTSSVPGHGNEYPSSSTPIRETEESSSTPCASSTNPSVETKTSSVEHPYSTSSVPTSDNEYPPYGVKSSSISKPSVETKTYPAQYPASSSIPSDNDKKSSTDYAATTTVPHYDQTESTPCSSSTKPIDDNVKSSSINYPSYPASSSIPSGQGETSTTEVPQYPATTTVPHYENSASTPCSSSTKPIDNGVTSSSVTYPASSSSPPVDVKKSTTEYPQNPATTTVPHYENSASTPCSSSTVPVGNGVTSSSVAYPASSSSPPVDEKKSTTEYPQNPATTTVPHYENTKSTPCPSSTKPVDNILKSSSVAYPEYPVASSSTPAYHPEASSSAPVPAITTVAYPTPTPAYPVENKDNSYGSGKGYGYRKRTGAVERRKANKV